MWETADLVPLSVEILNGELHLLSSDVIKSQEFKSQPDRAVK